MADIVDAVALTLKLKGWEGGECSVRLGAVGRRSQFGVGGWRDRVVAAEQKRAAVYASWTDNDMLSLLRKLLLLNFSNYLLIKHSK